MLYHITSWIDQWDIPGSGLFQYITFRAAGAIILSLTINMVFGKKIINLLRKKQIGEDIRDLGLEGQMQKKGTPTMGGLIILASILIPTLLFARLDNIYIWLMIITTIWLGLIGFIDDYIKVFRKDKKGLAGKFKIIGQVSLGIIVVSALYFSNDVVVRKKVRNLDGSFKTEIITNEQTGLQEIKYFYNDIKSTATTIPFMKNQELDYKKIFSFLPNNIASVAVWIFMRCWSFLSLQPYRMPPT
jgi:phospho-N-acetylmuramoyl-pentapeptide-transferase